MKIKKRIPLLVQSLFIGYFIFLMIHPSMPVARLFGFISGFAVFYASWQIFPSIARKGLDTNKFSLLFLLSLFFPYYLLRDYHFVALIFFAYYIIVYLFSKYTDLSESLVILFLIISLSFSVLHINMNHEYIKTRLEKSLVRTVEGPVRYRILVPEMMNLAIKISGLKDLFGLSVIFRFLSLALVLLSTYLLVMMLSSNRSLSLFLPLLYIFMIPFSWDVLYVTDFPEILLSTLFIYNMLKKNYIWSGAFFILGALNRDTMVFNLVFFALFTLLRADKPVKNILKTIKREKKAFLFLALLLFMSLALKLAVIAIYGKTWAFEHQLASNLYSVKDYISRFERFNFQDYMPGTNRFFTFLAFSGGIYALIMLFPGRIRSEFLIGFLLTFLLFIPLFLYIGTINETRILYIFYPYIIVCLAYILKDDFNSKIPHAKQ